jgi:hypothetical protein
LFGGRKTVVNKINRLTARTVATATKPGHTYRPETEIHRRHRRALRSVRPARRARPHSFRQWPGVRRQGRAGLGYGSRRKDSLYRAGQPVGERFYRVIQRQAA